MSLTLFAARVMAVPVFITQFIISLPDDYTKTLSEMQSEVHANLLTLAHAVNIHVDNVTVTQS